MLSNASFEQDLKLKRFANAPIEEKPHFNWRDAILDDSLTQPDIQVDKGDSDDSQSIFDLAEVADTIGHALTDLMLSEQGENEANIFTEQNRSFVSTVVRSVADHLHKQALEGQKKLSQETLNLLIEKILIEHDAHDVAKSLVFQRSATENEDQKTIHTRLIRRNGQIVPWNASKIEIAVRKAFLSLQMDSEPAVAISQAVTEQIVQKELTFIHIEDLQDLVQELLMRQGYYKVAESYILYRARRSLLREQTALQSGEPQPSQESMIVVKKADGSTYFWDGIDLKKRVSFASIGLDLNLDEDAIEKELRRSVFAEITEADLRTTIILNAKSLIEKDADFTLFAGRILLTYIYEETLGWNIVKDGPEQLKAFHQKAFQSYLKRGIKIKRLNPKLMDYDLKQLADALDPSADLAFDYLGIQTLYDRYLIVDKTGEEHARIEPPQFFWMRVSMGLFLKDIDREAWVTRLYNLYKGRRFCSSTPTLFNSGTLHSQLSSCYLYKVDDSLESIMQRGISENAYLSKWAGGLGGSWTAVRGTGGHINGTNGESQGVIPFLKLHNDQLVAVNQGGKRRGSGCAYLESWHNDMFDFLELRRNTGDDRRRTHDMNTANWIPDLFMKRMEAREDWTLFRSHEVSDLHDLYGKQFEERYTHYEKQAEEGKIYGKTIPAIDMWKSMLKMLFETGHPWITFKDPCNLRSPQDHVGTIHSSNLCTEITLNTSDEETAVCNLGSVVLDSHLKEDGSIDHEKLKETITIAIRALDNVIDINYYPTKAAQRSNERHRPIGMGVMGLQNALYQRGHSFASQEAVEFNDEFMEAIAFYAYEASSDLAAERGSYTSYAGSKWDRGLLPQDTLKILGDERGQAVDVPENGKMDWQPVRDKIEKQGMRNSNVLAIAPTATISNIMGTTPCIEPSYKNLFVKSNLSGEFIVLNRPLVKELKELKLWNDSMLEQLKYFDGELNDIDDIPAELKERYSTTFAIDYTYLIDAAARRQKWIDQSQSVNLFLAEPDLKTLSHMYRAAWRKGLKTTYYLRTLGASNIEKATVSIKKETRGLVAEMAQQPEAAASSPQNGQESASQGDQEDAVIQTICPLRPSGLDDDETCEACQ